MTIADGPCAAYITYDSAGAFFTFEQVFSSALDPRRFTRALFGIFAAVALLLAMTGIYGVLAYTVSQRTREIGIRMAMGAQPRDVLKLILGQGMKRVAMGVVLGAGGAVAWRRLMAAILYGVSPTDPLTFIVIAWLLTGVALLACWIPARYWRNVWRGTGSGGVMVPRCPGFPVQNWE